MVYLSRFTFPDSDREFDFFLSQKRTCYDSFYPFQVLSRHAFLEIDFSPVTILYGGNGSGKTTALNIIAEKVAAARDSAFNIPTFFRIISPYAAPDWKTRPADAASSQAMMCLITCSTSAA